MESAKELLNLRLGNFGHFASEEPHLGKWI